METDIDERISEFLENQKKHFSKTLFSTREIADAVGLTLYQARGCLEVSPSLSVQEQYCPAACSGCPGTLPVCTDTAGTGKALSAGLSGDSAGHYRRAWRRTAICNLYPLWV